MVERLNHRTRLVDPEALSEAVEEARWNVPSRYFGLPPFDDREVESRITIRAGKRRKSVQADLTYLGQRFRQSYPTEAQARQEALSWARVQHANRALSRRHAPPSVVPFLPTRRKEHADCIDLEGGENLEWKIRLYAERARDLHLVLSRYRTRSRWIGVPSPSALRLWLEIEPHYRRILGSTKAFAKQSMASYDRSLLLAMSEGCEPTFSLSEVATDRGLTLNALRQQVKRGAFPSPLLRIRKVHPGKTEHHYSALQYAAINAGYSALLTAEDLTREIYEFLLACASKALQEAQMRPSADN